MDRETALSWTMRELGKVLEVTMHLRRGDERRRRGMEPDHRRSRVVRWVRAEPERGVRVEDEAMVKRERALEPCYLECCVQW